MECFLLFLFFFLIRKRGFYATVAGHLLTLLSSYLDSTALNNALGMGGRGVAQQLRTCPDCMKARVRILRNPARLQVGRLVRLQF